MSLYVFYCISSVRLSSCGIHASSKLMDEHGLKTADIVSAIEAIHHLAVEFTVHFTKLCLSDTMEYE